MSGFKCRKVEGLLDDFISGKLPENDRIRVEMHLGTCAKCTESLELWKGFVNAARANAPDPLPPLVERRLAIAAAAERGPATKATNWKHWVAVTSGAAAFSILALIAVVIVHSRETVDNDYTKTTALTPGELKPATQKPRPEPGISSFADGRRVIVASPGTKLWLAENADVKIVSIDSRAARFRLNSGRVLAEVKAPVKGYRFIVSTPNGEVEAKGTIFSVEICDDGKEKARVIRGVIEVRQNPRDGEQQTPPLTLRKGEEGIVGQDNSKSAKSDDLALDLALVADSSDEVRQELALLQQAGEAEREIVEEASYKADSTRQNQVEVASGDNLQEVPSAKKQSPGNDIGEKDGKYFPEENADAKRSSELEQMVSLALAHRKAGSYEEAAATYSRLINAFPQSAASRNALVSLGQLELVELNRPKEALDHFNDYLVAAPTGFLAEEARLGKVRSLNRLGRIKEVERAASEYLEAHPGGYAGAEVMRLRGDSKVKLGNCQGAVNDYGELKARWPNSRQNDFAAKGLKTCGY